MCSYCRSSLLRSDEGLKQLGTMAEVPEDISPLQLGVTGVIGKKTFEVVGRLVQGWEDGYWNEWYLLLSDGTGAWLGEAQGFWMYSERKPELEKSVPGSADKVQVGKRLHINGVGKFHVNDRKRATCIASEGSLPFASPQGRTSVSFDLSGDQNAFATLDYSVSEPVFLYLGQHLEFESFQFKNLRTFEGWSV